VLAMVLLDESPSAVQITGVAVVLAGIVLATVGRTRRAARPSEAAPVELT
jgi:drug/metabolite transporter (DMT)-like permease